MILYIKLKSLVTLAEPIFGRYEIALLESFSITPLGRKGVPKKYVKICCNFVEFTQTGGGEKEQILTIIPYGRQYYHVTQPRYISVLWTSLNNNIQFWAKDAFTNQDIALDDGTIIVKLDLQEKLL